MRFRVLTTASKKMSVFGRVSLSHLVEVHRRFGRACIIHHGDACLCISFLLVRVTTVNSKYLVSIVYSINIFL